MNPARRLVIGMFGIVLLCAVDATAKELERADYKMSLPDDATIQEPASGVDADRMTAIDLPTDSTMIILVIDDKTQAADVFATMTERAKKKLKDAVVGKTDTFTQPKATRSASIRGTRDGMKVAFEIGEIDGKNKACIVEILYRESTKAETLKTVRKWMKTLVIKE